MIKIEIRFGIQVKNMTLAIISLIVALHLSACMTSRTTPTKPVVEYKPPPPPNKQFFRKSLSPAKMEWVKTTVSQYLKDPSSAQYQNLYLTEFWQDHKHVGDIYCGQVNTKNIYGAYTGFQWFGYFPENATKMLFQTSSVSSDWHMIQAYCLEQNPS